jgi:sulfite exporter TauE/SafE
VPGSLALSALLLALFGTAHCAAMCGSFVAASWTPLAPGARPGPAQGLPAALALHAGRLASYAAAGAISGALGATPALLLGSVRFQAAIFAVGALVLALTGLRIAGVAFFPGSGPRLAAPWWPRVRAAARRLGPADTAPKRLLLGTLWGWAPCALVYSALPLALVSGSAAAGAAVMLAFGVGTLPALVSAGWLFGRAGALLPGRIARRVVGTFLVVLAAAGLLQALGVADTALGAFCVNPAP